MFRVVTSLRFSSRSFPRARGDVPPHPVTPSWSTPFSPRTRGCSEFGRRAIAPVAVFPAHAGMFLIGKISVIVQLGFPRARGDVPKSLRKIVNMHKFSPRTRGCSGQISGAEKWWSVFPAHAGMFLDLWFEKPQAGGFPRARGDVPYFGRKNWKKFVFSPRTRGCS